MNSDGLQIKLPLVTCVY